MSESGVNSVDKLHRTHEDTRRRGWCVEGWCWSLSLKW